MSKASRHRSPPAPASAARPWLAWAAPAAVLLLTAACFLPSLQNGFLYRDDRWNLVENPYFRGLGWTQLKWMLSSTHYFGNYEPVSWLVYGLTYVLWGLEPAVYHLTGACLHALAALAFYFTAKRLIALARVSSGARDERGLCLGAAFAALFFGLHPLRVEVAAWASAQHYSVSMIFYLLCIIAYLEAQAPEQAARRKWLAASLAAFVVALLSYSFAMTLPLVLLILDVYPLRRWDPAPGRPAAAGREILWEKAPFFLAAAAAGLVQVYARSASHSLVTLATHPLAGRVAEAVYGLAFYLRKTVLPIGLLPFYRIPRQFDPFSGPMLASAAAVALAAAALVAGRRRWPGAAAAAACYAVGLLPVLGIMQSGMQLVADRYSYFPCLGWAVLAGAALTWAWARPGARAAGLLLAAAAAAGLGVLTVGQIRIWKDDISLWKYTLARDPDRPDLHYDLAYALARNRRLDEAVVHYQQALQQDPSMLQARVNLGTVFLALRKPEEAAVQFEEVLRARPRSIPARYDLGLALMAQRRPKEALAQFRELSRLYPDDARARGMVRMLEDSLRSPRPGPASPDPI